MELTPENIVDQIKQLLPEMAEFEDSDGNLIQGSPIPWLVNLIREHGEQQRKKGYKEGCKKGKRYDNGTNKRT